MAAADTNVILRLVLRDNAEQLPRAEAFVGAGAWISLVVLAETISVLRVIYHFGPTELINTIAMLLQHENAVIQDRDVVAEALDQYRSRPALGFSDCLILATARKAGHLPLGTFDKALATLDGTARL